MFWAVANHQFGSQPWLGANFSVRVYTRGIDAKQEGASHMLVACRSYNSCKPKPYPKN